jgi:hypothetical protein
MADFSCASTKRAPHRPPVRFRVSVVVAAFALAGCNANQAVDPSSHTKTWEGGHYVEDNPYNPISYAQNNTGRGGGR